MKNLKNVFSATLVFLMIFACSNKATSKEATQVTSNKKGTVAVEVGDIKITDEELKEELELLPEQLKALVNTKEGKKQFIDSIVTREMIYAEAKAKGYENNDKVVKDLEKLKKRLVIDVFLRDVVKTEEKIDDKQLKEYFKKHEKEFESPEKVHAKHILVKDKKLADEILEKLKKDPSQFEKLAQEHSIDSSGKNGGDLGFLEKGSVVPEFKAALDKLNKEGQISPVVKTNYGYHIIKFVKREKGLLPKFDDVKDEVKELYLRENQRALFDKIVNDLKGKYKVTVHDEVLNKLGDAKNK